MDNYMLVYMLVLFRDDMGMYLWHFGLLQLSLGCSNTVSVYSHHSGLSRPLLRGGVLPVLLWFHHSWPAKSIWS